MHRRLSTCETLEKLTQLDIFCCVLAEIVHSFQSILTCIVANSHLRNEKLLFVQQIIAFCNGWQSFDVNSYAVCLCITAFIDYNLDWRTAMMRHYLDGERAAKEKIPNQTIKRFQELKSVDWFAMTSQTCSCCCCDCFRMACEPKPTLIEIPYHRINWLGSFGFHAAKNSNYYWYSDRNEVIQKPDRHFLFELCACVCVTWNYRN